MPSNFSLMNLGRKSFEEVPDRVNETPNLKATFEDIKKSHQDITNIYTKFFNDKYSYNASCNAVNTDKHYNETLGYFGKVIRNGKFKSVVDAINSNVFDEYELTKVIKRVNKENTIDVEEEVVNFIEINGMKNDISNYVLDQFAKFNILFDVFAIESYISEDSQKIKLYEPYKYIRMDDKYILVDVINGYMVEKIYDYITNNLTIRKYYIEDGSFTIIENIDMGSFVGEPIKVHKSKIMLSTFGLKELCLMSAESISMLQSENLTTSTNIFASKKFYDGKKLNWFKNGYVVLDSISNVNAEKPNQDLFQQLQGNFQTGNYQIAQEIINRAIAENIKMPLTSLGLAPAQVAVEKETDQTKKRINDLKQNLQKDINDLFIWLTGGEDYQIKIEPFEIRNRQIDNEQDFYEIQNGLENPIDILSSRNPKRSEEENWKIYLTWKSTNEKPLTFEETIKAIELGIIPKGGV